MTDSPHDNLSGSLIAFATRWGSQFGGVNSFNADLLPALRLLCARSVRVICVVLHASQAEKHPANGVEVLSLERPNDSLFSPVLLSEILGALARNGFTPNRHTVWLGHDRITGPIAVHAAKETAGISALIHHMSYAHYEAYAEGSNEAEEKEQEQRALFTDAQIVMAVGPTLRNALSDLLYGKDIPMVVPGLAEIPVAPAPHTFTGFLSGRISEQTNRIKQAHLGVAAFAAAIQRANSDAALPDILAAANNPSLKVRGLCVGRVQEDASFEAEVELQHFAEKYAERVVNLRALPFTVSRSALFDELRGASVALMPSWHEGFGLAGWEAIAAGVPLILSKASGVYRLLQELDGGVYCGLLYPVDIRGAGSDPYFRDEDLHEVSAAIIQIAKDPRIARNKAAQLRELLLSRYTWNDCAREVLALLSLEPSQVQPPVVFASTTDRPTSDDLDTPSPDREDTFSDPLELPSPRWSTDAGLSTSQLLRAEEGIVPFDTNRIPFLNDQIAWAESEEFAIALRLLTGEGGAGKTRLALELCRNLRDKGWWAGFLRDAKGDSLQIQAVITRLKTSPQQALVVIDYAETRISDVLTLIKRVLSISPKQPLRILLLARGGGDWWERLEAADPVCETFFAGRASSGPFMLPPLYDDLPERAAAFTAALTLFSRALGIGEPEHTPDLSAEYYSQPLLIQMAALMALYGEHPHSAEGLTRGLVNHERRYWASLLGGGSLNNDQAAQLMALSTLANGLQIPRAIESIWTRARCGTAKELKHLFTELKQLYPGRTGLEGLRPDLLGEALVAQVLLSADGSAILDAILATSNGRIRHHTWTVLARIMRKRADIIPLVEEGLTSHYANNAPEAVRVCSQTPGPLEAVLERAFDALPSNLKLQVSGILSSVLHEDQLPLNELALRVSQSRLEQEQRRIGRGKASVADLAALAGALTNMSVDLGRCGQWAHAIVFSTEAHARYRELAHLNPKRFKPDLAGCLNNYATDLTENGRIEEAEAAGAEAVKLYESLLKEDGKRFAADLATSVLNYGNALIASGRIEEAVIVGKRSVDLHRSLASRDHDKFDPDVGLALNNYAGYLSESGRMDAAVEAAKEALAIRERLAKANPGRFEQAWAASLNTFAARLGETGNPEEALVNARQALDIYRRLVSAKPQRFAHHYAGSLHNYAAFLSENGQLGLALDVAKQAVERYEELAGENPDRFEPDLAMSLGGYAGILNDNGHVEDALHAARRAVKIRERLARNKPERFEPNWASSLGRYAHLLSNVACYAEAYLCAERALDIHRRWASKLPLVHEVNEKNSSIRVAFLAWLNDSDRVRSDVFFEPVVAGRGSSRSWAGVLFFNSVVASCLTADHTRRRENAAQALLHWDVLDPAMQRGWEALFFLAAALREQDTALIGQEMSSSRDWRSRYKKFVADRRGFVPAWLQTAAKRLQVQFPSFPEGG